MKRFTNIMTKDRLPLFFENYERVPEIVKELELDLDFDKEELFIESVLNCFILSICYRTHILNLCWRREPELPSWRKNYNDYCIFKNVDLYSIIYHSLSDINFKNTV